MLHQTPITKSSPFPHTTSPTPTPNDPQQTSPEHLQHIWVVTGPAGSGKSTVGRYLQQELGVPFLEGDDYHPPSNKEKMSNGTPLTDADRWDWLIALRSAATSILSSTDKTTQRPPSGVVVACSALKQKYRDVMRVAAYGAPSVRIHFIYLKLDAETLVQRVSARKAHYMKPGMVQSQLRDLEEPVGGEWDVLTVGVQGSMGEVQREVRRVVRGVLEGFQ